MSLVRVLSDVIDGIVEITTETGELASERLRGIVVLVAIALVLLFLLFVFLIEPVSGTLLALALIVLAALYMRRSSSDIV